MTAPGPDAPPRRLRLLPVAIVLSVLLVGLCCVGLAGGFLLTSLGGGDPAGTSLDASGCGQGDPVSPDGQLPRLESYGPAQMRNAAIIITIGRHLSVPPRGWVIAVATAMQESRLSNLGDLGPRNDHDSLGLFQQRPSQGWGTPAQIMDPAYASRQFYQHLLRIDGWQNLSLTDAAQRVQRSAFPDAYAKHEPIATQIVNLLAHGAARAVGAAVNLRCAAVGEIAASGWIVPVHGTVGSGFRTADRPGHDGVDLIVGKGTEIHAAAAGRVLVARCDPDHSGRRDCDVDGFSGKGGCGWFVDILHAGGVITRYCHLVRAPFVHVGDLVRADQVIGRSGSSGNSSGPHLHFEVHLDADRSSSGAINPVPFMRDRGASLEGSG